ncbi:hypothetical protein AB0D10_05440 [Kitasatospora sp. NPDC048545]|uniref:hypothetical protein n=1 Tax=Kitasatospora sp. NPDC048545 TaxID=3157208 RepID=UPI003400FDAD
MTRAEALARAAEWAHGAEKALEDSTQAHEDARRLMAVPGGYSTPEVSRLISLADKRSDDVHILLAVAQTWAAIAAATPEAPQP